ncbi:MAG: hypothetical protein MJE66_22305 [Proteobacteria bacterium]|nr:hypothetical protein [Pseudomonadota bacterium]
MRRRRRHSPRQLRLLGCLVLSGCLYFAYNQFGPEELSIDRVIVPGPPVSSGGPTAAEFLVERERVARERANKKAELPSHTVALSRATARAAGPS